MKIGHFGPTFIFPVKTVNFFEVKRVAPSSTLKMRKSHKKSARVYAYTHAYTQSHEGGGRSAPPGSYRVNIVLVLKHVNYPLIILVLRDLNNLLIILVLKDVNVFLIILIF